MARLGWSVRGGVTAPEVVVRLMRVAMYGLAAGAGVVDIVTPAHLITNDAGVIASTLWAVLLFFGGAACAAGCIRGEWIGEYVGIPALITALLCYGVASLLTSKAGAVTMVPLSLIVLSMACCLVIRLLDAASYKRAGELVARSIDGAP